jgi:hypothetical protein
MTQASQRSAEAFDLNIGKVLEHWTVPFAIREVIANALDEATLSESADPVIAADGDNRWRIRDFGRGLRYTHLTQNENAEKRKHPEVIGQFGMGLKDALATFDRRGITVAIRSPHGDITTGRRPKAGFADVTTLHALVGPAADPTFVGTEVVLDGVTAEQVEAAKRLFLRFSGETVLETTGYGQVLARVRGQKTGRVYVKGLLVAEEENFLFSYNITDINAPLRRALNRERSNVGRGAYTDRVKKILIECRSPDVARPLADDLAAFTSGRQHDELSWRDVALHACRVLQSHEKVVFVTAWQLQEGSPQLRYAQEDGYRLITVPDDIARSLGGAKDLEGRPLMDLSRYRQEWNDSFNYTFIDAELTPAERIVYDQAKVVLALAGSKLGSGRVRSVTVSETMRLSDEGDMVVGVWEEADRRIIVRRDQLRDLGTFAGTLLHELGHATSGETDGTFEFETELTRLLGVIAAKSLHPRG